MKTTSRFFTFLTLLALTFGTLGVTPAHAAGIRYAIPTGTGDCSSWATACTLQTALTGAASGDEIWVAAGTYKPTAGTDRSATFQLINGVAVYGGFAGTETARDQRNPATNVTILSGDLNGDDSGFTNNTENSYHVTSGATGATLDGVTITGGNASGNYPNDRGGGMYNTNSNPTLANVTFSSNSAGYYGGGMYNLSSSPTLINATFSSNSAGDGGGMYNDVYSSPTLMNVTFSSNSAYAGGGMYNDMSSSPTLTDVIFSSNSGGMYNDMYSSPTLTNVTFIGNSFGGMNNLNSSSPTLTNVTFIGNSFSGMVNFYSSPTLTNVTFSGNLSSVDGGGMDNYYSNPMLTNVVFSGNSAGNYGGGIRNDHSSPMLTNVTFSNNSASWGGGMLNIFSSSPNLMNVTFSDNSATYGGGMVNRSSFTTLENVTFSGNSALNYGGGMYNDGSSPNLNPNLMNVTFSGNSAGSLGGGMYNDKSSPTLTNVTFSGNTAGSLGGGMYNDLSYIGRSSLTIHNTIFWGNTATNGGAQIYNVSYSSPPVSDSVVEGGCPTGSTCTHIVITDPKLGMFGNYGGFTQTVPLLAGSSAIDTGNDATCASDDQRGIARPQGAHCDIGAYEYVDTTSPTVNIFTVTTPSNSLNIPITVFTASDDVAVTGYMITESATAPAAGATGWTAIAPTAYMVTSGGSYTLYPWAKDAAGNVSAVFGMPASVVVMVERAKNGGFETYTGTSKIPKDWKAVKFGLLDGKDTLVKKVGKASVKIVGAGTATKTLTQTLALGGVAGDAFAFSYWVKGSKIPKAGTCQVQVMFYSGTSLKGTQTVKCPTAATYNWKQMKLSFTAPAAYTKVVIKITFKKASGTVWFDGLSLKK